MTNEKFQKALWLVREAFKSGTVQCCTMYDCDFSDEKPDAAHVSLHPTVKYRIKPQPREVWLTAESLDANPHQPVTAWPVDTTIRTGGYRWLKFREVLDD